MMELSPESILNISKVLLRLQPGPLSGERRVGPSRLQDVEEHAALLALQPMAMLLARLDGRLHSIQLRVRAQLAGCGLLHGLMARAQMRLNFCNRRQVARCRQPLQQSTAIAHQK
jgi:hypothetical protein